MYGRQYFERVSSKPGHAGHSIVPYHGNMSANLISSHPSHGWSPSGPGTIGEERSQQQQVGYRTEFRSPPRRRFNSNRDPSGQRNTVDIDRIRRGTDVRTTVSVRALSNSFGLQNIADITLDHVAQHPEQGHTGALRGEWRCPAPSKTSPVADHSVGYVEGNCRRDILRKVRLHVLAHW